MIHVQDTLDEMGILDFVPYLARQLVPAKQADAQPSMPPGTRAYCSRSCSQQSAACAACHLSCKRSSCCPTVDKCFSGSCKLMRRVPASRHASWQWQHLYTTAAGAEYCKPCDVYSAGAWFSLAGVQCLILRPVFHNALQVLPT